MAGRNKVNEALKQKTEVGTTDIKSVVFQYLKYWYIIIACFGAALFLGKLYHDSKIPMYSASAQILINDDSKGANNELAIFEGIAVERTSTSETEILEMKSASFVEKIVNKLKLNVSYIGFGRLSQKSDLYDDSPFVVDISQLSMADLDYYDLWLHFDKNEGVKLSSHGEIDDKSIVIKEFPFTLPTDYGNLIIHKKFDVDPSSLSKLFISVRNPTNVAKEYANDLSVRLAGKGAPILEMSINTSNKRKGIDFLNVMIEMYNKAAEAEKEHIAQITSKFINDRIKLLSEELGSTERKIEQFKKGQKIVEVSSNAQLVLQENTEYEKKRMENETQIKLIKYLKSYVNDPKNKLAVIPSNIGITEESLNSQVNRYNELLFELDRLLNSTSESNPVVVNKKIQLASLLGNVRILVDNILQGLTIAQTDLENQSNMYKKQMSAVPTQERRYMEIDRQRQIQSSLFLMLLQKREENALAMAATISKAKVVVEPNASFSPIAPDKNKIMMMAGVVGLAIPIGLIFLFTFLSPKLASKVEIKNYTKMPMIASLPNCGKVTEVFYEGNDKFSEPYRLLRTKLLFNEEYDGDKVFMLTSMKKGVGKTFVLKNLAKSFSLLNKKVLMIDADFRQSTLSDNYSGGAGLSDYLCGNETLQSVIKQIGGAGNLYVMPVGECKEKASELITDDKLDELFDSLRQEFDYIFVDATDLSKYTDALILNRVTDVVLAIARIRVSDKTQFKRYDELYEENELRKIRIVLNGDRA